jgi:hypothetical protein
MRENSEYRKKIILAPLDTKGVGLEVAPYFNPFLDKSEFNAVYTDYISTEELRQKAALNPGAVTKSVPEIDFVWQPGLSLKACMAKERVFDYAVASHVVEHVPNTIGWLNNILEVIKVGGVLALAVPNKLDGFDYYRKETTVSDLVGNYIEGRDIPTPAQVFDFMSRCVYDDGTRPKKFGEGVPFEAVARSYSDDEALSTTIWTFQEHSYLDVHCTVWTEQSFVECFRAVAALGLMNVTVSDAVTISDSEFIVHITKKGAPRVLPPNTVASKGEEQGEHQRSQIMRDLQHAREAFHRCNAQATLLMQELESYKRPFFVRVASRIRKLWAS